jgi:hypothetical protein
VLECLVKVVGLTSECSRETWRAVHTGMQFYMPVGVVSHANRGLLP